MDMKRIFFLVLSVLTFSALPLLAYSPNEGDFGTTAAVSSLEVSENEMSVAGESASAAPKKTETVKKKRVPLVMGKRLSRDTTLFSRRSLKSHLIIPKNDWQIGMSAAYMNLSSDNSELLLLLDNTNTYLSLARISINGAYAYSNNHAVGLRIRYTNGNCNVDASTLDLLGNFTYELKDVHAKTISYGGEVFNRSYVGLDDRGRIGVFLDTSLGYTRSRMDIAMGSANYTITNKISLALSPGVVYFPMNTISVFAYLSLADISYNNSRGYKEGVLSGVKNSFRAQARIDLLAINFGLTVHL